MRIFTRGIFSATVLASTLALVLLVPSSLQARRETDLEEIKRIQDQNSKILAETVQTMALVRQELQLLRGMVEENSHFLQEQTNKDDRMIRDFDYRLTGIEERISLFVLQLEELRAARGLKKEGEATDYRRALTAINLQNPKEAITLFDQFMAKYPHSSLADNAQYWKGEAFYALKDYSQAVLEFQNVLKKYPKSDKVPAALLKQGFSFYELGSYLDAKAFLGKLIGDFPKSQEADAARERVAKIEQILTKGVPPPPPGTAPAPPPTPPATAPRPVPRR